jgi:DNA repair protein RadC
MQTKEQEQRIIEEALRILTSRLRAKSKPLQNAQMVKTFLRLHLEQKEREHFSVLFLDTQNRLIEYQVLFMGSIDSATINPREVVKAALQLNARSLIVAHNHPSGDATPSQQDINVTKCLISALELIDVKLLDHMVIGHNEIISLAEKQLM